MRDGLRTLTELVERIEGGDVVVDDAAISRVDDDDIAVDLSVRFPENGATAAPVGDGGESADDRLYRGGTNGTRRTTSDGGTEPTQSVGPNGGSPEPGTVAPAFGSVPPEFGTTSARVGGPALGAIAEAMETADWAALDASRTADAENESSGPAEDRSTVRNGETPENCSGSSSTDELVPCRVDGCDERFETDHGMKIHATKAHQSADGTAPSPHRNPERLREVYETCDTFEEMTEALDVDVTSQTVRRSMMRLGVHDPTDADGAVSGYGAHTAGSATTSDAAPSPADETTDLPTEGTGDSDDGSPSETPTETSEGDLDPETVAPDAAEGAEEPADGADGSTERDAGDDAMLAEVDDVLPPAVDGAAFVDAVRTANTLYEVQRRLDMDRGAVQTLLAELDLLDLVHGRVATQGEREEQKAEIERRILEQVGDRTDEDPDARSSEATDERVDENADERASDGPGEQARAD